MGDRDQSKINVTAAGKARQSSRDAQRAEALRANLARRKAQARERADDGDLPAEKPGDA